MKMEINISMWISKIFVGVEPSRKTLLMSTAAQRAPASQLFTHVNAWNLAHAVLTFSRQSWMKLIVSTRAKFWSRAALQCKNTRTK